MMMLLVFNGLQTSDYTPARITNPRQPGICAVAQPTGIGVPSRVTKVRHPGPEK